MSGGPESPRAVATWTRWGAPILVAVVTLAAFLPALEGEFVNWDDQRNFLDNQHYRGLGSAAARWMFTSAHMGHYIPLTWMTLGLDYVHLGHAARSGTTSRASFSTPRPRSPSTSSA